MDLNPVRAGIVGRPEEYRWNSLGYHLQTGNKDGFLSLDFGLTSVSGQSKKQRLALYRQYVYEKGSFSAKKGKTIAAGIVEKESRKQPWGQVLKNQFFGKGADGGRRGAELHFNGK